MRILHLNSELNWRGGEQQLAYLLASQKSDPTLNPMVMGKSGSAIEQWCLEHEIPFITAKFRGSFSPSTIRAIAKNCKKYSIELMHAHTSHAHASALYSKLFLNKAKLIIHRRVSYAIKPNYFSKKKYVSKHIKKIICISENVRDILVEKTNQPEKTTVIYDAIDTKRFDSPINYSQDFRARYLLPNKKFIISNTAALSEEKDYHTFIDTAAECIKRGLDAVFLIVGSGSQREELANYIQEKSLDTHIYMLGFVKDINDILSHSDLFLVTSKQEGLGSSILDAFAKKVPVVATRAGGIPEIVIHEKTGFLSKIGDSEALASQVLSLLQQPELANTLSANSYNMLLEKFLVDHMADETKSLYQKVLSC